jgi:hypothetical protein
VARVKEAKGSVLVVRGRGRRGGELNLVVLSRALDKDPLLQRVGAHDLGHVVAQGVHEARPVARIGPVVDGAEPRYLDVGDLLGVKLLPGGKKKGKVDPIGATQTAGAAAQVACSLAQPVGAGR